jgi:hypothetical protein
MDILAGANLLAIMFDPKTIPESLLDHADLSMLYQIYDP